MLPSTKHWTGSALSSESTVEVAVLKALWADKNVDFQTSEGITVWPELSSQRAGGIKWGCRAGHVVKGFVGYAKRSALPFLPYMNGYRPESNNTWFILLHDYSGSQWEEWVWVRWLRVEGNSRFGAERSAGKLLGSLGEELGALDLEMAVKMGRSDGQKGILQT